MRHPTLWLLVVLVPIVPTASRSATFHVPTTYPTIQAGIDAASYGDTVEVACGSYTEIAITMKSGVTLRSTTGDWNCAVFEPDPPFSQFDYEVITCPGDSTTRIEGFWFRNMYLDALGALIIPGSAHVRNCRFENVRGVYASAIQASATPRIESSIFIGNLGAYSGSGRFYRCEFVDNYKADGAGTSSAISGGDVHCEDCTFIGNRSYFDAGAIEASSLTIIRCLFLDNSAGRAIPLDAEAGAIRTGALTAVECTFYGNYLESVGNEIPRGTAISVASGLIKNCTIIGSRCGETCGYLVYSTTPEDVAFDCSNLWWSGEDSWHGFTSQLGQNDNVSVDPEFCDPLNDDFTLSSISPCLDTDCGTMGAFGLGCYDEKPGIISINDVGNDQGRQVRLTWYRSLFDEQASGVDITGYAIYRRQDLYAAAPSQLNFAGRGEAFALPGWDYVTTVPARRDDIYQVVVPTLCDSTLTSGPCWSAFFVSALTATDFYDSPIDSGYSKDNLPPPTPANFGVAYNTGAGNQLVWDAVAAADFASFKVYRGTTPGLVPSEANRVATTTQTTWIDPGYDGWLVFYKVTSVDNAGNESEPASSGTVTGTDHPRSPLALALGTNIPNPFNPTTRIPFAVPSSGLTRVAIYNVRGELVRVLVDRVLPVGEHETIWDGRDDGGAPVSSGIYLCRLEHPSGVRTRKLVAIK